MDVKVVWPEPSDLFPEVLDPYVDVHNLLSDSIKLTGIHTNFTIRPSNLLFNGMHGMGKTLLAATLAVELGKIFKQPVPLVVFDCSEDTREYALMGTSQIMPDGTTAFVPGPFPLAMEMANRVGLAILCAEEISALSPGAQKVFNRLTDWRRSLYVPQLGKPIALKPYARVLVVGTMNPSGYGGVYTLNPDLRSRFTERVVPLPSVDQERRILKAVCPFAKVDDIEKALVVANDVRASANVDYKLSTRDIVQLLENIAKMDDRVVPLTCIADKFEGSDREFVIDRIDDSFATNLKTSLGAQA